MAYEATDWVWSPDETTNHNYVSNLATIASSIENKVGRYVYSAEAIATITDTTNFGPHTPGNVITAVREGKYVTVAGTWAVKTANYIQGNAGRKFARVPVGMRPKKQFLQLMQGSGNVHWLLTIQTNGDMEASRQTEASAPAAGFWMPMNVTYLAED